MKKKYLVWTACFIYAALLFLLTGHFEWMEMTRASKGPGHFGAAFGERLGLLFYFLILVFLVSSAFLLQIFVIHDQRSPLFLFLSPFLNMGVTLVVGFFIGFILWISGMEEEVTLFRKIFVIVMIATLTTTIWLLGGMTQKEIKQQ